MRIEQWRIQNWYQHSMQWTGGTMEDQEYISHVPILVHFYNVLGIVNMMFLRTLFGLEWEQARTLKNVWDPHM